MNRLSMFFLATSMVIGMTLGGCKQTNADSNTTDSDSIMSDTVPTAKELVIPTYDIAELEKIYADNEVVGGFITDDERDKTFLEYAIVDIDHDGLAEVVLQGKDHNQGAIFSFGSGKPELVVRKGYKSHPNLVLAEWADTAQKKYPGYVTCSGGVGTGVSYSYYVKVEKSRPVSRFSDMTEVSMYSGDGENVKETHYYAVDEDEADEETFNQKYNEFKTLLNAVFGEDGLKNQELEYEAEWKPVER